MRYRKAKEPDIQRIQELLEVSGLPSNDIDGRAQTIFIAEAAERLVGTGGIETFGRVGLIRSVAVAPEHRNNGIAKHLYTLLEVYARDAGVRTLYLITDSAEEYFQKLGFSVQARDTVPELIKQTSQFSRLCPSSATIMCKALSA